jgi:NDP-sugar pyrophosphorylase family protein
MKALILAGGYGTRLHPITLRTSKCVLPVAGVPNIVHLINRLKEAGIDDIIISMNKNQESIEKVLGDGSRFGVKIRLIIEETSSDRDKLGADDFIIAGGDNFFSGLDIKEMINFHKKRNSDATIALYHLDDRSLVKNYGIAVLEGEKITSFQEKPSVEDALSNLAAIFFYIVSRKFVENELPDYIEKNPEKADRPGDLWEYYAKKMTVNGFVFSGFFGDIGNAKTYITSNTEAMKSIISNISEKAMISSDSKIVGDRIIIGDDVVIENGVKIVGPVMIEKGCRIMNGSEIGPFVTVLKGTEVGSKSAISNSILFEKVRVGEGVRMHGSIADGKSSIGSGSVIESGSIIGYSSELSDNIKVLESSRVWPFKSVESEEISGDVISDTDLIRDSHYFEED